MGFPHRSHRVGEGPALYATNNQRRGEGVCQTIEIT